MQGTSDSIGGATRRPVVGTEIVERTFLSSSFCPELTPPVLAKMFEDEFRARTGHQMFMLTFEEFIGTV